MAMTDFTIIRRSLSSRLFSTVTTALTVAVAVALMLVLLSLRDSGRRAFERGSGNVHLLVSRDASPLASVLNGMFYANAPQRAIEIEKFEELKNNLPLEWAIPTQLGDSYRGLPVLATTAEFFTKFQPAERTAWEVAEGRLFEKDFEVVIGADARLQTGLKVGDVIHVTHGVGRMTLPDGTVLEPHVHKEFDFTIVGIMKPTGTVHDRALYVNLMSSWIMHAHDRRLAEDPRASLTTAKDVLKSDEKITGILIRLPTRGESDVPANLPMVFSMLRSEGTVTVAQPAQEIGRLFTIVSSIDQVFLAMAAAVLLSSGIAIMLALYNSMEQRRRQIAVLRVLGCSRGRVFGLILTESALLGIIGAAIGVVACFVGLQVVVAVIREQHGVVIEPSLVPMMVLAVVLATVFLAAAAGVVPAVMAYKTAVAKNLKPLG